MHKLGYDGSQSFGCSIGWQVPLLSLSFLNDPSGQGPCSIGAGSRNNEKITYCTICVKNGFKHEAIVFYKPVEFERTQLLDYFQPIERSDSDLVYRH